VQCDASHSLPSAHTLIERATNDHSAWDASDVNISFDGKYVASTVRFKDGCPLHPGIQHLAKWKGILEMYNDYEKQIADFKREC
jgi:hypothetical protein